MKSTSFAFTFTGSAFQKLFALERCAGSLSFLMSQGGRQYFFLFPQPFFVPSRETTLCFISLSKYKLKTN